MQTADMLVGALGAWCERVIVELLRELVTLPPGSPEWCAARDRARALLSGIRDAPESSATRAPQAQETPVPGKTDP